MMFAESNRNFAPDDVFVKLCANFLNQSVRILHLFDDLLVELLELNLQIHILLFQPLYFILAIFIILARPTQDALEVAPQLLAVRRPD